MTDIISVDDLPADVQSGELVWLMVAAANAKGSRVAPCLAAPTTTPWAAATAYALGDMVRLAEGQFLQVTVAGTSASALPAVPPACDATVVDGTVTWKRIAPTTDQLAEAKLALVGAIKRWSETGSGGLSQKTQTAGPFNITETVDTRQRTGYNLWPTEITQLQDICKTGGTGDAFTIDTAPSLGGMHLPWCSLNFGATYCSCGVDIACEPIFELGY